MIIEEFWINYYEVFILVTDTQLLLNKSPWISWGCYQSIQPYLTNQQKTTLFISNGNWTHGKSYNLSPRQAHSLVRDKREGSAPTQN